MFRVGIGKDIHITKKKVPLILGGVNIPSKIGLISNTDGDIVIHSLIDALFGASNLGDIGQHFGNEYKNFSSIELLEKTVVLLKENGIKIINLDFIITAEEPKLNPYFPKIKQTLGKVLNLDVKNISLKAGTNEGLGYLGKKKAMECECICLIEVI